MIKQFVRKQLFNPTWIGIFVNPFWISRRALWKGMRKMANHLSGRLLDVGCGKKPYRELFVVDEYVGLEIDTPRSRLTSEANFFYDGNDFPFDNNSFDSVLCNQTLEHVFNPDNFLKEIHRVIQPGGQLLLSVPFVWDEHEQPYDYARYSSFGLAHLLREHGFEVIEVTKTAPDVSTIFQLINGYLFKISGRNKLLLAMTCLFIIAPFTLFGKVLSKIFFRNPDLYLDQIVLAKKQPK
jgi:SAM-dependent methyltransferase